MMKFGLLLAAAATASGLSLSPATDKVIKDEYIVLLHSNISTTEHTALNERVNGKKFSIGKGFRAVHATLNKEQLSWVLAQEQLVQLVEHNQEVRIAEEECSKQSGAPWGLVRTTASGPATVVDDYEHDPKWGNGVDVYVVDTGIRCTHEDFRTSTEDSTPRCEFGIDTVDVPPTTNLNSDENGHGSHCASTSGGLQYGIAKSAYLIAVKVLNAQGSGSTAGVIDGVDFVAKKAAERKKPSVANLSLGGGKSTAMNNAVDAVVQTGVSFAVAAGNDNKPAKDYSPASAELCVTVGSTEKATTGGQYVDARSYFSNYGEAVDIFAPGSDIKGAWYNSDTATATISGTSMASPHVAGVMAIHMEKEGNTPAAVKKELDADSQQGDIVNPGLGSPNKMLHRNSPCPQQ